MNATRAVDLFAALSESTRLRIVRALLAAKGKELCNCELVDALQEPQPNVSRHLRVLANAGIVRERRDGRWVYFGIVTEDPAVGAIGALVAGLEDEAAREDAQRLRGRLGLREGGKCVLGVQNRALLSETTSLRNTRRSQRRKEARR